MYLIQKQMLHKNSWQYGRVVRMGQERQNMYVLFCFKASAPNAVYRTSLCHRAILPPALKIPQKLFIHLSVTVKNVSMEMLQD